MGIIHWRVEVKEGQWMMNKMTEQDSINNIRQNPSNEVVLRMEISNKSPFIPPSHEYTSNLSSSNSILPKSIPERKSQATQTDPLIQNCRETNTKEICVNEKEELFDDIITVALTWLHI